jgi:hypothetical protein
MSHYENKMEDRTHGKYKNVVIMKYRKEICVLFRKFQNLKWHANSTS